MKYTTSTHSTVQGSAGQYRAVQQGVVHGITVQYSHIVPCGKFHRIGGAPRETFSSEKYDAPEEVGGERKSFNSPIRK